jgi:hypothetical protein
VATRVVLAGVAAGVDALLVVPVLPQTTPLRDGGRTPRSESLLALGPRSSLISDPSDLVFSFAYRPTAD